jgi:ankyrin repeat protein
MKKLLRAIGALDLAAITALLDEDPGLVSETDASGKNALHYTCEINVTNNPERAAAVLEIVKLLLERGGDINSTHQIKDGGDILEATPLWHAYAQGRNMEAVAFLLEQGAPPDNCLFAAAWNDDIEAAELFKGHGAAIDAVAHDATPFSASFLWRKFAIAEWFLQNGANVDFADAGGRTVLYHAIRKRFSPAQIQVLVDAGADPGHEDNQGATPLQVAQRNRDHAIVKLLEGAQAAKA